jgi:hypothetical protein
VDLQALIKTRFERSGVVTVKANQSRYLEAEPRIVRAARKSARSIHRMLRNTNLAEEMS